MTDLARWQQLLGWLRSPAVGVCPTCAMELAMRVVELEAGRTDLVPHMKCQRSSLYEPCANIIRRCWDKRPRRPVEDKKVAA